MSGANWKDSCRIEVKRPTGWGIGGMGKKRVPGFHDGGVSENQKEEKEKEEREFDATFGELSWMYYSVNLSLMRFEADSLSV